MSKYTLEIGEDFEKVLNALTARKGVTKSEIIRRAVGTYSYLVEQSSEGNKISVTTSSDQIIKDIVLP